MAVFIVAGVRLRLNGEETELPDGCTIAEMVAQLDLSRRRIAVEVNRDIVPRTSFAEHVLCDGDVVEVVHFIGGG